MLSAKSVQNVKLTGDYLGIRVSISSEKKYMNSLKDSYTVLVKIWPNNLSKKSCVLHQDTLLSFWQVKFKSQEIQIHRFQL